MSWNAVHCKTRQCTSQSKSSRECMAHPSELPWCSTYIVGCLCDLHLDGEGHDEVEVRLVVTGTIDLCPLSTSSCVDVASSRAEGNSGIIVDDARLADKSEDTGKVGGLLDSLETTTRADRDELCVVRPEENLVAIRDWALAVERGENVEVVPSTIGGTKIDPAVGIGLHELLVDVLERDSHAIGEAGARQVTSPPTLRAPLPPPTWNCEALVIAAERQVSLAE